MGESRKGCGGLDDPSGDPLEPLDRARKSATPGDRTPIRAVAFDLGGVFFPWPDGGYFAAWERALNRAAGTLEPLLWHGPDIEDANVGRISADEYVARCARRLAAEEGPIRQLLERAFATEAVDQELVAYTRLLRTRVRTAALTNTWSFGRRLARERGIADLFDVFVSSAEVGVRKPDPRIFEALLRRLDLQPSSVAFVDDTLENVEAAERLGFHAIHFESTAETMRALDRLLNRPTPDG